MTTVLMPGINTADLNVLMKGVCKLIKRCHVFLRVKANTSFTTDEALVTQDELVRLC